jgi:hypothetical protein
MVEQISVSAAEAAILTEGVLNSDGCAHLRRPYNGSWVGDIKMFRSLEHRDLMKFVDYQEAIPVKDRARRSRITDAGRTALIEKIFQGRRRCYGLSIEANEATRLLCDVKRSRPLPFARLAPQLCRSYLLDFAAGTAQSKQFRDGELSA